MEASSKSLVDQIMDAWFADLEQSEYFNPSALEKIKQLASQQELKRPKKVISAIKMMSGGKDEDS